MPRCKGKLEDVDVIMVTPFGVYCCQCEIPLRFAGGVTPHKHLATVHGVTVNDETTFHEHLHLAIRRKRSTFVPSDYLDFSNADPDLLFYCWKCSKGYQSLRAWLQHTPPGGGVRCNFRFAQCDPVACVATVCGRVSPLEKVPLQNLRVPLAAPTLSVPISKIQPPSISYTTRHGTVLKHNFLTSSFGIDRNGDALLRELMELVGSKEAARLLLGPYGFFLARGQFRSRILPYVRFQEVDNNVDTPGLSAMLNAMERYFIDESSSNKVRERILPLHQFQYTTERPSFCQEAAKLIRFCWRIDSEALADIKQFAEHNGSNPDAVFATGMFPLLMVRLALDQCHGYDELTLFHRYCLSLGFFRNGESPEVVERKSLATHASLVATALDLIHVGACLYLPFLNLDYQQAMVTAVRVANATSSAQYLLQQLQVAASMTRASSSSTLSSSPDTRLRQETDPAVSETKDTTSAAGSSSHEEDTQDGLLPWQHPAPEAVAPAASTPSKMGTVRSRLVYFF